MRSYPTAVATHLAARSGLHARVLLWLSARNRETGALETMGLWNGDDHQSFTIGGQTRTYYAGGALMEMEPITLQTGLVVRMQRVILSPLSPEVAMAMRGYEPRFAPVEIHQAFFDPASITLLAEPTRVFKGFINEVLFTTAEVGSASTCTLTLASNSQILTRKLALRKSNEAQQQRYPGDTILQYADVSGAVPVVWGDKIAGQAQATRREVR